MEALHENGIVMAEVLQDCLGGLEKFWLWATYLGDPKSVILLFFPIAYFLDRKVGVAVFWIAIISEWLNLVFKWFLFGERPFWWVHETGALSKRGLTLQQFPATCETGPGSPSGHCMITGAALWPAVIASSQYMSQRSQSCLVRLLPIALYFSLMLAVGLSRIFILSHFPHQVLAGFVTGVILGHMLSRNVPDERAFRFYVIVSLALLLVALLLYWSLMVIGIDISWSIQLANKWCSNPKWVRMDSRPFASLARSTGSVFGLGLSVHSPLYGVVNQRIFKGRYCASCMVLAVLLLNALDYLPMPTYSTALFYSLYFLKNVIYPLIVVTIVPGVVNTISQRDIPSKSE